MGVFGRIDRALDRMDRVDDWVRDRLPAGWVKAHHAPPPRSDAETRRSDLMGTAGLLLRFLAAALVLAAWLAFRGTWWAAILAALVAFVAVTFAVVLVREVRRR